MVMDTSRSLFSIGYSLLAIPHFSYEAIGGWMRLTHKAAPDPVFVTLWRET